MQYYKDYEINLQTVIKMLSECPRACRHSKEIGRGRDGGWRALADIAVQDGVESEIARDLAIRIIEAGDE